MNRTNPHLQILSDLAKTNKAFTHGPEFFYPHIAIPDRSFSIDYYSIEFSLTINDVLLQC